MVTVSGSSTIRRLCPVDRCDTPVDRTEQLLMCSRHWHSIPRDIRRTYLSAWRRLHAPRRRTERAEPIITAWVDARDAAIAAAEHINPDPTG